VDVDPNYADKQMDNNTKIDDTESKPVSYCGFLFLGFLFSVENTFDIFNCTSEFAVEFAVERCDAYIICLDAFNTNPHSSIPEFTTVLR